MFFVLFFKYFLKKNILRLCLTAKRDPRNLKNLNFFSLIQINIFILFLKKYILRLSLATQSDPRRFDHAFSKTEH